MITEFINENKSYVIAPAGHGKTHAIADIIELLSPVESKPILVLTHTQAGVASIKAKLSTRIIGKDKYQIETICSFTQRYVKSLLSDISTLPNEEDIAYFDVINELAKRYFRLYSVQRVISKSYSHLLVDEYQDCTYSQHEIIMSIGDVLPCHILGDPLQSIFDFNGDTMVDMTTHLSNFKEFHYLTTPWRWNVNDNCKQLGEYVFKVREKLIKNEIIHLTTDENAHLLVVYSKDELSDYSREYFMTLKKVIGDLNSDNILILVPQYIDSRKIPRGGIKDRIQILSQFDYNHEFIILEAIDDKSYYSTAKDVDNLIITLPTARKKIKKIKDVIDRFDFRSTDISPWFGENTISVRRGIYREPSLDLSERINTFISHPTVSGFCHILNFFQKDRNYRCKRTDKYNALIYCMKESIRSGDSIEACMRNLKNRIRRNGRKIEGKCIGTTLLTKGLEFDNVVILDAHNFIDKRNFYVAISRACKNLIIITKYNQLSLK